MLSSYQPIWLEMGEGMVITEGRVDVERGRMKVAIKVRLSYCKRPRAGD